MYRDFHARNGKYGFAHHLTTKGAFFKEMVGKNQKVLDLGCRDGVMTSTFASGNEITCVDVDDHALQLCGAKLSATLVWHDLNDPLPFEDGSFDVVVLSDVLEHVLLHEQLVKECNRVMKCGGWFYGSTPNAFYWSNRIKMLRGIDLVEYIDPTHVRHFALDSLAQLLAGLFHNVEVIPYGRHPFSKRWPTLFANDFLWKAQKPEDNLP